MSWEFTIRPGMLEPISFFISIVRELNLNCHGKNILRYTYRKNKATQGNWINRRTIKGWRPTNCSPYMGNIPLIGSQLNQVDSAVIPSRHLLVRSGFTAWFLTEIDHGSDKRTKIKSDLQLQITQKGLHWKLVSQCNSQLVNDTGMLIYNATCKWELFFDLHHNAKIQGGGVGGVRKRTEKPPTSKR